jgi:hypothetical protein
MITELISVVEILEDGQLLLRLKSGGRPSYQYVYRAAAGVYWDSDREALKFSPKKDGQYGKWFEHIVCVARSEIELQLQLDKDATWKNVPKEVRDAILCAAI